MKVSFIVYPTRQITLARPIELVFVVALRNGSSIHEMRRFCGQSDEIDGIGQKTGPFLGREGLNDSSRQKKGPFLG